MVKIMIDPGHGGDDSGAINGIFKEKDFTLQISLGLREYLLATYNVEVLMTRTTDKTVSLQTRTDYANLSKVDYFISIHINDGGNGSARGYESYIYNGQVNNSTISDQNIIHASIIKVIGAKYGVTNRGTKRADFHVLRETIMDAILLENLFINNSQDLSLLKNDTFRSDLIKGIGDGLAQSLKLTIKTKPTPPPTTTPAPKPPTTTPVPKPPTTTPAPKPPTPNTLFKVYSGSFKDKTNADNEVKFLTKKGISSFIVQDKISGTIWYRVQAGSYAERINADNQLKKLQKLGFHDAFIVAESVNRISLFDRIKKFFGL